MNDRLCPSSSSITTVTVLPPQFTLPERLAYRVNSLHLKGTGTSYADRDLDGQGNDLYIQSAILVARGHFVDADIIIRKAIDLHENVKSKYGLARDFSTLSTIVWHQSRVADRKVTEAYGEQDAFTWLAKAMQLFEELEASQEYDACEERRNIMQEDLDKPATQHS